MKNMHGPLPRNVFLARELEAETRLEAVGHWARPGRIAGMNLTNELAKQRNRDAAERTLMAWIRTCLSLISFGFGLDKIVAAIKSQSGVVGHAGLGVRLVSMAFVLTGMVAMASATVQHRRDLRRLNSDAFVYREQRSIATATAVSLTLIGAIALAMLAYGGLAL